MLTAASSKARVTKGDVICETRCTVTIEDDGSVEIILEAPDNADDPAGGTWQLVEGDAETLTVADCCDDLTVVMPAGTVDLDELLIAETQVAADKFRPFAAPYRASKRQAAA